MLGACCHPRQRASRCEAALVRPGGRGQDLRRCGSVRAIRHFAASSRAQRRPRQPRRPTRLDARYGFGRGRHSGPRGENVAGSRTGLDEAVPSGLAWRNGWSKHSPCIVRSPQWPPVTRSKLCAAVRARIALPTNDVFPADGDVHHVVLLRDQEFPPLGTLDGVERVEHRVRDVASIRLLPRADVNAGDRARVAYPGRSHASSMRKLPWGDGSV